MKNYLVFDMGGTCVKYALMDEQAAILEQGEVPTPSYNHTKESFYQVLDQIAETYLPGISGIAVSMPGMLDSRSGYCMTAGHLTYLCGTAVADELTKRYQVPVSVENDGKCAALAEHWRGSLKGYENGAVVVLGTGVAGGIILNGRLYRGNRYTAGEYSYICANQGRPDCTDSYWGITGGAEGLARAVAGHTKEDWHSYDGRKIFRLANAGDAEVLKGLKDFTDGLAVQIYNLNIVLDLDIVAVGGGISRQPLLHEYLQKSLDELVEKTPLRAISSYIPKPKLTNCTFYNDANLIGALYHYKSLKEKD